MVRPISDPTRSLVAPLNSHHRRAIISVLAADGRDGGGDDGVDGAGRGGISSMSHQTHEEECLESTS